MATDLTQLVGEVYDYFLGLYHQSKQKPGTDAPDAKASGAFIAFASIGTPMTPEMFKLQSGDFDKGLVTQQFTLRANQIPVLDGASVAAPGLLTVDGAYGMMLDAAQPLGADDVEALGHLKKGAQEAFQNAEADFSIPGLGGQFHPAVPDPLDWPLPTAAAAWTSRSFQQAESAQAKATPAPGPAPALAPSPALPSRPLPEWRWRVAPAALTGALSSVQATAAAVPPHSVVVAPSQALAGHPALYHPLIVTGIAAREALPAHPAAPAAAPPNTQPGWRECRKCGGLFFAGGPIHGVCPADRQPHDGSQSALLCANVGESAPGLQGGWRWCRKCQGMFFAGGASQGICPVDHAPHDGRSGPHYAAIFSEAAPWLQGGWRWCRKCQGMFLPAGVSQGICPVDHHPHDASGSGHYAVHVQVPVIVPMHVTPPPAVHVAAPPPVLRSDVMALHLQELRVQSTPQSVSSNNMKLSFDYCLVTADRNWLNGGFLTARNWFVPHTKAGEIASGAGSEAGSFEVLPVAAVVVQNLQIQADWSQDDLAVQEKCVKLGPFSLVGRTIDAGSNTISCKGMQIIGWVFEPMPCLPPNGDPALAQAGPPAAAAPASGGTAAAAEAVSGSSSPPSSPAQPVTQGAAPAGGGTAAAAGAISGSSSPPSSPAQPVAQGAAPASGGTAAAAGAVSGSSSPPSSPAQPVTQGAAPAGGGTAAAAGAVSGSSSPPSSPAQPVAQGTAPASGGTAAEAGAVSGSSSPPSSPAQPVTQGAAPAGGGTAAAAGAVSGSSSPPAPGPPSAGQTADAAG